MIQSQSASFAEVVLDVAGVDQLAARFGDMKRRRLGLQQLLDRAARRSRCGRCVLGTMSSSSTGTPALATCAAMPAPITPAPMTRDLLDRCWRAPHHSALQIGGDALAAADALRRQRVAAALALQQARRLAGDAGAGGAERMAERDGAAVEVQRLVADAEFAHAGERLRGEGLVQLDDVDGARSRCPARCSALRVAPTGPMPMMSGAQPATATAASRASGSRPCALGVVLRADQHGGRAVGQRRGGAGGHRALLVERRLQPGERLLRGVGADAAVLVDRAAVGLDRHDLVVELAVGLRRGGAAGGCARRSSSCAARVICQRRATFSAVSPMPM